MHSARVFLLSDPARPAEVPTLAADDPRILVAHDGEIEDVCGLLRELGSSFEEQRVPKEVAYRSCSRRVTDL